MHSKINAETVGRDRCGFQIQALAILPSCRMRCKPLESRPVDCFGVSSFQRFGASHDSRTSFPTANSSIRADQPP
jgi:hypothetical protein